MAPGSQGVTRGASDELVLLAAADMLGFKQAPPRTPCAGIELALDIPGGASIWPIDLDPKPL